MTTQETLHAAQGAKMPLALADADTKNAARVRHTRLFRRRLAADHVGVLRLIV